MIPGHFYRYRVYFWFLVIRDQSSSFTAFVFAINFLDTIRPDLEMVLETLNLVENKRTEGSQVSLVEFLQNVDHRNAVKFHVTFKGNHSTKSLNDT